MGDLNLKDSRVVVYDGSGAVVREIKTGVPSDGLALDSQGRLYVASYGDNAKVFDANGSWLGCLSDEAQANVPLNLIAGIDILSDGTILTCGGNTVTIYRLADEKEK
jgi:sugar lactone lactonase YvrE